MTEIYSIDNLTLREVKALRQGLDFIEIKGIDALFLATLQLKINEQVNQIQNHINEEKNKDKAKSSPSKRSSKK